MDLNEHAEPIGTILTEKPITEHIPEEHVLVLLTEGWTENQILENYSGFTDEIFNYTPSLPE